ncbi:MAG TPA: hypothetical protein VGD98_09975, partial [Ktedonobacteraceae bacterium]
IEGQLYLSEIDLMLNSAESAQERTIKILEEAHLSEQIWLEARTQYVLGRICNIQKHYAEAIKYFQQALAIFDSTGMRLEYGRTLQAYSEILLQYAQNSESHEQNLARLDEARQIFQDCHAYLDLQEIEKILTPLKAQKTLATTNQSKQERRAH